MSIRQEIGPDNIAVWWFDAEGKPVNTLSRAVMVRLEELVAEAGRHPGLAGIILASAKPSNFIAGADLDEMRGMLERPDAAAQARQASALGHRVYSALEALRVPTVAAIRGGCMGGGTELALACRWRLAADDNETKIALPETQLGILPAWGGCTRLTALAGVRVSLDMILSGRQLRAKQAFKMGVVDALMPPEDPVGAARAFLKSGPVRRGHPLVYWLVDANPLLRPMVLSKAGDLARAKSGGHYPALDKAIGAIRAGLGDPARGFAAEEAALAELVASPITRHLVEIFFMTQENRKYTGGLSAEPRTIERVGVLGAGLMGAGIAQVAAAKGLAVRLKDTDAAALARGLSRIAKDVKREPGKVLSRIATSTSWEGFAGTQILVEAVPEILDLKRKVLKEFQAANAKGIFASNTSTLQISSISEGAPDPSRVVGIHFFNPVPKMPLIEVIPSARTSPEVTATALAFAKKLGKFVVLVQDRPGFLVNRILAPYLNEAALLLEEGAPIGQVDRALRRFGMPMGPVELIQQVGLGVVQHAGKVMQEAFPERLHGAALLSKLKPDQPFYLGDKKRKLPNPAVEGLLEEIRRERGVQAKRDWTDEALQERLVLPMVNEAAYALEEKVVSSPREVDLAMIFGTGFAPFRGGLLRHADAVGTRACLEGLERLEKACGKRFAPAPLLQSLGRTGRAFYA